MPYMDGKGQVSPVLRFFWCTATGTRKVSRWMSCSPLGQTATPMVGTKACFIGPSISMKGFLNLFLHAFGHMFAILHPLYFERTWHDFRFCDMLALHHVESTMQVLVLLMRRLHGTWHELYDSYDVFFRVPQERTQWSIAYIPLPEVVHKF